MVVFCSRQAPLAFALHLIPEQESYHRRTLSMVYRGMVGQQYLHLCEILPIAQKK